jgi:hypothetical protein
MPILALLRWFSNARVVILVGIITPRHAIFFGVDFRGMRCSERGLSLARSLRVQSNIVYSNDSNQRTTRLL